ALPPGQAVGIASGHNDSRIAALNAAVASGDARAAVLAQALLDGAVKVRGDDVYLVGADVRVVDAASGAAVTVPDDADDASSNNRMRGALEAALAGARLV